MDMIKVSGADGEGPRIDGWNDSGAIAVITWHETEGQNYQQEFSDEQAAIHLLRSIEADDNLVLISAQLRRLGIGPAG